MSQDLRSAWLEIDLNAIAHNIATTQKFIGQKTNIMAIAKANAYGHGLIPVAKTALKAGAKIIGVALPQEGQRLRESGIHAPILVLGPCLPHNAATIISQNLSTVISGPESLSALAKAAQTHNTRARIHIKVDTGMGRIGCTPNEALDLVQVIAQNPHLELEGLMSHIAWEAPQDHPKIDAQLAQFKSFLNQNIKIKPKWIHLANSATTLQFPKAHYNLVRVGLLTYGLPPVPTDLAYQPALSLKAKITQIRTHALGQPLSYGGTHVLTRPSRIALLPLGYADGYSRLLSNRAEVLLHGHRCPVVGNVCMDLTLVDITDVPNAQLGDTVTLLGKSHNDEITPQDIATWSNTIVHEVIAQLSDRLPRHYTP